MTIKGFLKKGVFFFFARNFVAGESIEDVVRIARGLKKKNVYPIINILGEKVREPKEAIRFCNQYIDLILRLFSEGLIDAHISVKPSQLGLEISEDLYRRNLATILGTALIYLPDSLVEIDREDRAFAGAVSAVSLDLARFYPNQRLACQINLSETPADIRRLAEAGLSVRLCKGAYPGDIKGEKKIRQRFLEEACWLAEQGREPAAATHDPSLIKSLKWEGILGFQVLLGIANSQAFSLARQGKRVGIYVPYGPYWFAYGRRRWKSIVKILLRNWLYQIKIR